MNRTLRLLAMDVAFLQAARQPMKRQQRQRQLWRNFSSFRGFAMRFWLLSDMTYFDMAYFP